MGELEMQDVYIVAANRTAFGKMGGALREVRPDALACAVLQDILPRGGVAPEQVDEVILGQTRQSAEAANIARYAALLAGYPERVPAYTVMQQCSGAVSAAQRLRQKVLDLGLEAATDAVNRCVTVSVGTASARATLPPSTTRPTRRCTRPRTRSGTVLCWAAGSTAGQNRSGWFQTDFIYRSRRFLARRARVFTFIMGVEDTKRPGNHRFLGLFSPFRCPCTSALTRFSPLFPSVFLLTWIMAFVKTVNVLLYILSSACSALII